MRRWSRAILVGAVVGSCIGCDQVTKVAAHQNLADHEALSFLGGMVRLSYVENPGAFLGLGAGLSSGVRVWLLGVMVALLLTLFAAHAIVDRSAGGVHLVGMAMIVGGGVGNLVDRVSAGVVRDFINMGIGSIRTGIFNLADLAITVGTVIVLCSWGGRRSGPGRPTRPCT